MVYIVIGSKNDYYLCEVMFLPWFVCLFVGLLPVMLLMILKMQIFEQ